MKKEKQKTALVIVILLVIAGSMFVLTELRRLRENAMQHYCEQEQQYVALQMKQLERILEDGGTEQELIQYIESEVPASGSFYYFLVKHDKVIFARNSGVTQNLGTRKTWEVFVEEVENSAACCITEKFIIGTEEYRFGKVIDEGYIADSMGITRFQIYGMTTFAFLILLLLAMLLLHAWWVAEARRKTSQLMSELKDKNLLMQQENGAEGRQMKVVAVDEGLCKAGETGRYRQYCFSFYLNATHAIYIDGQKGKVHPHTWEITLHLLCTRAEFVEFHRLEQLIEQYIERYQDKCLNEVAPFQKVNPTLENCCEEFKNKIGRIVEKEGFSLLMIEIKESPSRAYVINLLDEK